MIYSPLAALATALVLQTANGAVIKHELWNSTHSKAIWNHTFPSSSDCDFVADPTSVTGLAITALANREYADEGSYFTYTPSDDDDDSGYEYGDEDCETQTTEVVATWTFSFADGDGDDCSETYVPTTSDCDEWATVYARDEKDDVGRRKPHHTKTRTFTPTLSTETPDSTSEVVPGKVFGLIAIDSGTQFQNQPIKKDGGNLHAFTVGGVTGTELLVSFQNDYSTLVDQDGKKIIVDAQGDLFDSDTTATGGFSIHDNYFTHDGSEAWSACPEGNDVYSLSVNECTGGTDIVLQVVYV